MSNNNKFDTQYVEISGTFNRDDDDDDNKCKEKISVDSLVKEAMIRVDRIYQQEIEKLTVDFIEESFINEMVRNADSPHSRYIVLLDIPRGCYNYYYNKFFIEDNIPEKMEKILLSTATASSQEWQFALVDLEIRLYVKPTIESTIMRKNDKCFYLRMIMIFGSIIAIPLMIVVFVIMYIK